MSDRLRTSRRAYLKTIGVAGAAGITGLSGCIGGLTGGGGPIPMGSILPITGALSDYGSGMQAAVQLAEKHINDAGGPLGREIKVSYKDSETKADVGQQKYSSLVNEDNILGFVGAASSGVSTPIAEGVADDEVMQMSNASTSPALANIGYNSDKSVKYFGRTAPNDAQQGTVMGMIMGDGKYIGADKAAFLYVDNPYGEGLANKAEAAFQGETLQKVGYAQQTNDYTSTLDKLFQGDPQAIGFIGYPGNGKTILKQWNDGGYGGEWVLSEGLNSAKFFNEMKDVTNGMYVSSPDPEQTTGASIYQQDIGSKDTLFAPHAYDGMFLMALAMHKAGEASGTAIAKNIQSVSREGEVVTVGEFEKAKNLLDDGTDINYQGASSPVDLNDALEPLNQFAVLQVAKDGDKYATKKLETIPRSAFQ